MSNNHKSNTVNISCRIDKTLYGIIVDEAKRKGISVNSFVNSMIKKYLSWERSAENIGFIPLSKHALRLIFNALDDKTIKKIADNVGKTIPRELVLLNFHTISFENIINTIELWNSHYGSISHDIVGRKHTITVYHGVNKKFSSYIAEVHNAASEDLSCNLTITNIDRNMFSIELKEFV